MIFRSFLILSLSSVTLLPLAAAEVQSGVSATTGPVVVEVDGAKLSASDVERKRSGSLFQARNTFYQAERKAVEEFIDEYLLEKQAEKEHLTVPQLLERHVASTLPKDPSEESLRLYFEGVNTAESYETVRPQILEHIRTARMEKAKTAYVKGLRSQATIAMHLPVPRVPVNMKDTPMRGPADAKVMIVEYADYECPYCQTIQPVLETVQSEYKGKMAFAYKDVPLPMHSHAEKAAEAAHCADKQGKYWEYHDKLFESKQLDVSQLKEHAKALKLDTNAFNKCLESGEYADLVKAQLNEAQGFQIQGTPSFFINGRYFGGGLTVEQFRAVLDEELGVSNPRAETAQR